MRISILVPCHNEEQSVRACIDSCLNQTRPADEIVVVDDGSTDATPQILATYGNKIKVVTIPVATGNKSYAQEQGIAHVTSEVFIATDGDTILDPLFVESIEESYQNPEVDAVAGYVKSMQYNWVTACREIDYVVGQDIHKTAQANIGFLFVIPGCAGAFKTDIFRKYIGFDHDTLTEDLDFTFKLHQQYFKIEYQKKAVAYTQDPTTVRAYINQMRRWHSGIWQNLLKHGSNIVHKPGGALEISIIYIEGLFFACLPFLLAFFNFGLFLYFLAIYFAFVFISGVYAAATRKRWDLFAVIPIYPLFLFINSYVFIEQFFKEILLRRKRLIWFKPARVNIGPSTNTI
jgi:cellulose synthase/poly-beta-1,6-N-acetylglucosamine synthase-like glycosyltransferase